MAEGRHTCALVEEGSVQVLAKRPFVGNIHYPYGQSLSVGEQLPGHDVGVMLHDGEYDFAATGEGLSETGGHEVYGLGSATGENHLLFGSRVYIVAHLSAGSLLQVCGFLRERVDPSVYIGFGAGVSVYDRADHTVRGL